MKVSCLIILWLKAVRFKLSAMKQCEDSLSSRVPQPLAKWHTNDGFNGLSSS
jgi:hypothetical protein